LGQSKANQEASEHKRVALFFLTAAGGFGLTAEVAWNRLHKLSFSNQILLLRKKILVKTNSP
jgi:hypothetical protein